MRLTYKPSLLAIMLFRKLGNTGLKLSILSLGGSGFGSVYGRYSEETAALAVRKALDSGINYIDTAYWYGQGQSELFLGRALRGVKREKFIIGTKVGRYEQAHHRMFDFSAKTVTKSVTDSLQRLQLDYIDVLQIHDVEFVPSINILVHETLPALYDLKKQGLCRYIGITGYSPSILVKLVEESTTQVDCVLNYCRLTLNDSSLTDYFEILNVNGVGIINASPVGMGLLTPMGPQSWHPASNEIKTACAKAVRYCKEQGVDITKLAISYSTSFKEVSTTLVSMIDDTTVEKNVDAVLNPLTTQELDVQDYIVKNYFTPIQQKHWEGVEVEKYRKKTGK